MDKQSNKARFKPFSYFLVVTRCQQPCQSLTASRGLLGLLAAVLLEIDVFPTIVGSLAVEVMSVEVLVGFVVKKKTS